MLTPVRTVLFVIRPCMKQFKIRSCMLQSVTVQVRRTSALTVRTPSSPGFVEWSMPSDAWVDTTELSGEKKKEQSPDTVMEEPTEPAPGTVIAQVGQQDAEKEPSEPREETAPKEETRRVVLVTMEPEESTEVIVKPPEQEPEKSTEATVKPTEPVEKEKGLEMEKRKSEVPKDLPEPEIPEKPFVETEKAQEATAEQEVTFRMKAWSNWLHRQDQKDEEKRIRNRARQRALRQQRRSDRAAGLQQAVRKGPSVRRSWTVAKEDPEPRGSIRRVLKQHTKAPRMERTVKLRLVEREVQASRVTAKGEYMVQNKHRAWIAPKARPQPKASDSRVKKEFIEIKPQRGVTMVSLTGSEASDVGDMEEIPGVLPETERRSEEPTVIGLDGKRTDHERDRRQDRHHAGGRGCREKTGDQAWDRLLHEAKTSREGESEVHVPGQVTVEASRQRNSERDRCQYFRMDVGDSRSASPRADRGEPEEVGRIGQAAEDAFDLTDQSQDSACRPSAAASAAARMATTGQAATCSAAKEAASSWSGDGTYESGECQAGPEEILEVIAKPEEIPEPKTPSVPGPKTPPTKPKAKSRPLTEEQKAVAEEMLAQKAQDLLKKAERGTATLKREKESTASGSGAKKVPKYLEHLTDDQRAHLFCTELSSEREAEAIEREKELARREKEEEDRRKAQALYRSERRAQALEHGREIQRQRQEEFLKWKAEEEDRENLTKARRISLEQTSVPPGVILTPAPIAAMGENPSTPPEALRAPLSEEEIAYRKELQEHLSVQVFGQEGRREVGRDVRSVGREGRYDNQSVQVPPKRGVEPPIRARAFESSIRRRAQKGNRLHR